MTNQQPQSDDNTQADERLAAILDDLTSRATAGENVDVQQYFVEHPEFADRLRNLLPTIEVLVGLDSDRSGSSPSPAVSSASVPRQLGDFRLIQEIGRGGMGIVYEAEEISLQRRVALKVLPFASVLDERQLQRFRNEARAVAGLHHPNIVPVYSVGCERGVHYYAMQQVQGQSLSELIASVSNHQSCNNSKVRLDGAAPNSKEAGLHRGTRKSLELPVQGHSSPSVYHQDTERNAAETLFDTSSRDWFRRIADIGKQVADALEYAHGVAIVHRDIKPSNLLMDEAGKVWVADFGLAQVDSEAELTMTGELIGTLRYMSPEQLHGDIRTVDSRTDVFSLGATLYELLTLSPVRRGQNRTALLASKVEDAAAPRSINPAVPLDLETIVLRSIAADPDQRYRTAEDLAEDLQRFLDNQPIHARRPTITDRFSVWSRRNQGLLWGTTTVLAVVAIVSTTSALLIRGAHNETEAALTETQRKSDALEIQTGIAQREKQNAQKSYARLLAQRGIDGANSGEVKGLFDLADACSAVADIPDQFGPMSRLWGIAQQHHAGRIVIADPVADVIAFSPDSHYIAMARDNEVWMCSLATGQPIAPTQTVERPVGCLVFSPDGQRLIAHSAEGSGQLFSSPELMRIGQPLRHRITTVKYPSMMKSAAAFSPDGQILLTAGVSGTVKFWNSADGTPAAEPHTPGGTVTEVNFHPHGNWFVTGGETTQVWDLETRNAVSPLLNHWDGVNGGQVLFSPDGNSVATLQGLWDTSDWERQTLRLGGTSSARTFSHDSRLVACARYNWGVRLWDVVQRQPVGKPLLHSARVRALDFSPDGSKLACVSMSESVRVWDVETQSRIHPQFALPGSVSRVHFSSDGQYLAACSLSGPTRVWRTTAAPKTVTVPLEFSTPCVCFSSDGQQIAAADVEGRIHIVDFKDMNFEGRWGSPDQVKRGPGTEFSVADNGLLGHRRSHSQSGLLLQAGERGTQIAALAWSPDGSTIAVISDRNTIQFLNIVNGSSTTTRIGSNDAVLTSLSWHPDGKTIAIGAQDWSARVFDVETQSVVQTVRCLEQVHGIQFHENGKWIITGLQDGTLRVWDPETGQRIGSMRKHKVPVRSVATCEDFLVSVSGSFDDSVIRVWPANDDAYENGLLVKYADSVRSVQFVPGTETLAILDWNGELRLWELPLPYSSAEHLQQVTTETLGTSRNADGTLSPI